MALLSLTGLLMVMMVMMTISIGTKVKEKMELQTMSDAAAYSQAIATARTYNALSAANRVSVAYVVGVTAVQSLVSWSTYVYGLWSTIGDHWDRWETNHERIVTSRLGCCHDGGGLPCKSGCCDGPFCGICDAGYHTSQAVNGALSAYNAAMYMALLALDAAAWAEAIGFLYAADWIHILMVLPIYGITFRGFINNQNGVDELIDKGRRGTLFGINELSTPNEADRVNFDEAYDLGSSAIIPVNPLYYHHAFAVNGSRLDPFITNREDASGIAQAPIDALFNFLATHRQRAAGSGYVASLPGPQHGASMFTMMFPFPRFFSADDHSTGPLASNFTFDFGICFPLRQRRQQRRVTAEIWSGQAMGLHRGTNFSCPLPHMIGGMLRAYPWFMDYNPILLASESNIWGQPKNHNVVYRNYAARPAGGADQWNPLFRFGFSSGATYDGRGIRTKDGTDISRQVGFSTGVTYYHRGNNLLGYHSGVEPPNFFNPFWRGGLTRLTVDNNMGDVNTTFRNYRAAEDAFDGLRAGGFQGWQ